MDMIIKKDSDMGLTGNFIFNRRHIYLISTIAALGGLLFGFDLVIISGTVSFFSHYFHLNEYQTGWAVGCINLGCAAGALMAGKLSDLWGRKKILLYCALMFALTGIGIGWSDSFGLFILFRLLGGVAVGTAALVCPMYIAEIAPSPMRGRNVAFYQLAIVTGILLAYFSNYLLLNSGENNWRWMFTSQSVPALLFFFGLFLISESPRWLIHKKKEKEARQVLQKIGGSEYAETELSIIRESFIHATKEKLGDLFTKSVLHILFLGILIAIFSQIVGQNSIMSYAPNILNEAGMARDSAFLQSVILGFVLFIFTFIAIATIDKVGRRKLLISGSILLFIDAMALSLSFYLHLPGYVTLIFVLGFIAVYGATLGPVSWVVLSEIFPNRIRGNALALATFTLWIANFFTTASFPIMQKHFGMPVTFGIYGMICLIYFFYVRSRVPETKGKSLEEIEKMLSR
jgi:sugar porter (SP) family MFS transporter